MKYELIKMSKDNYTLKYKDNEYKFKTDVELVKDMQGINKKARVNMIKDLTKDGISMKTLSIEEHKDGKTYIDNSNKTELEEIYLGEAMAEFLDDLCTRLFGKTYTDLILDMELDEKEIEKFSTEFLSALTGQTPSWWKKKKL